MFATWQKRVTLCLSCLISDYTLIIRLTQTLSTETTRCGKNSRSARGRPCPAWAWAMPRGSLRASSSNRAARYTPNHCQVSYVKKADTASLDVELYRHSNNSIVYITASHDVVLHRYCSNSSTSLLCPLCHSLARVTSMVWWLATVIISATYTANLAAFLSSSRWNQPINEVVKLASQDDLIYG